MNKIFKVSLTLVVIVAATLLLIAGAGSPRYVGRFFGDGAGVTNIPQAGVVQLSNSLYYLTNTAVGGPTNGILMLNGFGTNTTLRNPTLVGIVSNTAPLLMSGTITKTNYTTGAWAVESAAGWQLGLTNGGTPTVNVVGSSGNITTVGSVTASNFVGSGSGLTNLPTSSTNEIWVTDFGAATNASASDNTAAFNAATQAATNNVSGGAKGRVVRIPAGEYELDGTVYFYAGVTLQGDGRDASVLNFAEHSVSNAVEYSDANEGTVYLGILHAGVKGLQIKSTTTGTHTNTGDGLYIAGGSAFVAPTVEDVFIRYRGRNGLYLDKTSGGHVDNMHVIFATDTGFKCGDNYITFTTFRNSMATQCNTNGWDLGRSVYSTYMGCGADANHVRGWYVDERAFAVSLLNCGAENNLEENYRIEGTFSFKMDACYCKGAWNSSTNGVVIDGARGISIDKCLFEGNGQTNGYAIYFTATAASGVDVNRDYQVGWSGFINDESRAHIYSDSYNETHRQAGNITADTFTSIGTTNRINSIYTDTVNASSYLNSQLGVGLNGIAYLLPEGAGGMRILGADFATANRFLLGLDTTWPGLFVITNSATRQLGINLTTFFTNGISLKDVGANIPTNEIPTGSASITNWWFGTIGGIPTLVATNRNHADGGWMQKALFP